MNSHFALLSLVAVLAGAPDVQPPDPDGEAYDGSAGETRVRTPRLPATEIRVDGDLSEDAWSQAAVLHGFTQYEPVEGVAASERTEVLVFVTEEAIHFGVRAFDDEPDRIRATLAERDEFSRSDDYVRLVLDTFDDQRRAYVFSVNPLGVQHDGIWLEGRVQRRGGGFGPPVDDNPDFIWETAGRLEAWGYALEIRIPFKSLRFREIPVQSWGLNVYRQIQRNGYESSWAPISGDESNQLTQAGKLQDLRDLDAGLFLEINPVATARRVGELDEGAGELRHGDVEPEFGANVTYGLTSNLTLDATYNPDFSQVEADAGQIAVNERFALFFPEKRPFFLEGTEIFSLPEQLVYTRSIVDPVFGAKLTGKIGSLNVGYLGAVDEVGDEPSDAVVNLVRARQDLGASSTAGLVYTDRTRSGDDYNRVGGADLRLVFARRYTVTLLGASSWTEEPEDAPADGGSEAESGTLLKARFERAGRGLSFNAELTDIAPEFEARSGFLRRTGDAEIRTELEYNRYGAPGALVEVWGPRMNVNGFWSHDDFWNGEGWEEHQIEAGARVSFRNNVTIFGTGFWSGFDPDPGEYEGLFVRAEDGTRTPFRPSSDLYDGLLGARLFFWVNTWERVRGNLRLEWRETPVFDRSVGVPVEPAEAWTADLTLNLFPTRELSADVGLRHESLFRSRDGSRYSRATIPRIKAQYQFSRAFFLRGIVEYSSQETEPLLDPVGGRPLEHCDDEGCELRDGSAGHDIHVEALAAYEPSPGTVVFLGYTRQMEDTRAFEFRDVRPQADGLFVKVSYRLRF